MELTGKSIFLETDDFPYKKCLPRASVRDQAHFVLPWSLMAPRARTLSQFNADDKVAYTHAAVLQFFAEAFTNACQWRGSNRGSTMIANNDNEYADRITIIMTYVPKEATNEEGDFLPQEELLADRNIAAVVFSFLVLDDELDIADMLSDQLDIERWGLPTFKKKDRFHNLVEVNEDEDDEQMELDNNDPLAAFQGAAPVEPMPQRFNDPAPQQRNRYQALDCYNSRYYFPGKNNPADRINKPNQPKRLMRHACITSTKDYCVMLGRIINHIQLNDTERRSTTSETFYISHLSRESPLHHRNMLSLEAAVEKLRACGAHHYFIDVDNWSDPSGQRFAPPEIVSLDNVARYPLQLFNAAGIATNCMPHCKVHDRLIIQPGESLQDARDADDDFDIDNFFSARGIVLDRERDENYQRKFISEDPFNVYFQQYASIEADLAEEFAHANTPQARAHYAKKLHNFREQGLSYFYNLLQRSDGTLPDGYVALMKEVSKRKWEPKVQHLYQSVHMPIEQRLSPLSQWRNNELMVAENLLDVGDSSLLLFPKLIRVVASIYMPFMGSAINKENMHVVGPPGTGKSDTVEKMVRLLIPGTWMPKVAASARATAGELKSQRILEFYNEIPSLLAPNKDLFGTEANLLQQLLVKWGDGMNIYESMRKNPITEEWEPLRQVAHNTNTFVGCRNPMPMTFTPNGSTGAIYDRATIHHLITLQKDGRATMAEKIFKHAARESAAKRAAGDSYAIEQRALMEYCGAMSCYGVSMIDISLFSDVAPLGVARIASHHPSIQGQLRNLAKIKTRVYSEILRKAVRLALFSAVGLAGRAEARGETYTYDTEEVINEIQRYVYCDMETLIDVMAGSMYDMTEGDFHAIANLFATEAGNYKPIGACESDFGENADYWPEHIDTTQYIDDPQTYRRGQDQERMVAHYSLERYLEVLLGPVGEDGEREREKGIGKDYLTLFKYNKTTGENAVQEFRLREYSPIEEDERLLEELLDDLVQLAEDNETQQPQPRLHRKSHETLYKLEKGKNGEIFINYNYVKINGDFRSFASSFDDRIGDFILNGDSINDLLWRMKRQTMITPYVPVIPSEHDFANRPGDMQSLRYSALAMRQFKRYKLPVLIQDNKCFYLLTAFCETRAHSIINNMIGAMTYNATREFNCLLSIPSSDNRLAFQPAYVRRRPGVKLKIAQHSNTTKEQLERIKRQFGADHAITHEEHEPYDNIDIEEERALMHLRRAFPNESEHELMRYTPRGIEAALYGQGGPYYAKEGEECPHTLPYEPDAFVEPRKKPQKGQKPKRQRLFADIRSSGSAMRLNESYEPPDTSVYDYDDLDDIISN